MLKLINQLWVIVVTSGGKQDHCHKCQSPLPSARQHPSYDGDCLEVKGAYYQNCSLLGCVTQCSQSAAHSCEQFLQVQQIVGLSHWDPYAMHRGGCLELFANYCNMVEWSWWYSGLICKTN